MSTYTDRILTLNDQLRKNLLGGKAVMTPGVAALGSEAVQRLVQTIAVFDDFCTAKDPHGEHDFGAFNYEASRSTSRSTISTKTSISTLLILRTPPSPSE